MTKYQVPGVDFLKGMWYFVCYVGMPIDSLRGGDGMETTLAEASILLHEDAQKTEPMEEVFVGCGKGYLLVKRLTDIVISVLLILLLWIPMLVIALLIRIDSQGPAIFVQKRLGRYGEPFTIYKFRTMKADAPPEMASCEFDHADQYITRIGAFLRRTSIDELPQLFNILKGDMSLVGYRPVCMTEHELNEMRRKLGVFALRPGITGLAQVSGRDNIYGEKKARLDAEYVSRCSAKMDIWCILKTIKTVFTGEGAI